MSVQPIIRSVTVKAPPAEAFILFADKIGHWWKKGSTLGKKPHQDIVIEAKVGGRWFERDEDGAEMEWGHVLAYDPPGRLLLAFQLNSRFQYDPAITTEVEVTFQPAQGGGTDVRLEHRNLERLGAGAEQMIAGMSGGWTGHIEAYGRYADSAG